MPTETPSLPPKIHVGSYADPVGTVFLSDGKILRGIKPEFSEFYRSLLSQSLIQGMLGKQLVQTTISPIEMETFSLVLEHKKIEPVSFCYEWPVEMLKDAALLTLDLNLTLCDKKLTLKDAYPWNVIFDGPNPVFVDFTSIMEEDPHLIWVAYDQFCRFFLFPLVVAKIRSGKTMRHFLSNYISGISPEEVRSLFSLSEFLKNPWLIGLVHIPQFFAKLLQSTNKVQSLKIIQKKIQINSKMRRGFFASLKKRVKSISYRKEKSFWSEYYRDIEGFFHPGTYDLKQKTVSELLAKYHPKTVVDIGCNQGGYSILAAQSGARTVSFDSDEDCISLLYRLAKERNLNISPLIMDFLNPSPASGWRAIQFPSAPQRFHSEMAMALALVHHLAITQRQTFDRIAQAFMDYSDKWLLTEFVPLDDPRSKELMATHTRDMGWYSLDNFVLALKRYYRTVELFPSHPDGRTLVLCTK